MIDEIRLEKSGEKCHLNTHWDAKNDLKHFLSGSNLRCLRKSSGQGEERRGEGGVEKV